MRKTPFSIYIIILISFLANTCGPIPTAKAEPIYSVEGEFHLPAPGILVNLSPDFTPPILKGIKVHPDNPFRFDFILDQGDEYNRHPERSEGSQLKQEADRLIKYFLASLTIPEKDLWVNLSPYEKNRIIPQSFGLTEMGRDLLAEDYMLKQITASLIYPEGETGKKFWKRIYAETAKKFGTTNIPVNTFNKVWIVPEKAVVYENAKAGTAYIVESKLKVMLEEDYLSMQQHADVGGHHISSEHRIASSIIREIVIPELNKEVNQDKNFAQLRQVYNSLILATWYKKKIKDSILEQVYADKNKVAGVGYKNSINIEAIYQRYLQAFKKGVFNYIKEQSDPMTQESIPRKYFSGGFDAAQISPMIEKAEESQLPSMSPDAEKIVTVNCAMADTLGEEKGGSAPSVNKKQILLSKLHDALSEYGGHLRNLKIGLKMYDALAANSYYLLFRSIHMFLQGSDRDEVDYIYPFPGPDIIPNIFGRTFRINDDINDFSLGKQRIEMELGEDHPEVPTAIEENNITNEKKDAYSISDYEFALQGSRAGKRVLILKGYDWEVKPEAKHVLQELLHRLSIGDKILILSSQNSLPFFELAKNNGFEPMDEFREIQNWPKDPANIQCPSEKGDKLLMLPNTFFLLQKTKTDQENRSPAQQLAPNAAMMVQFERHLQAQSNEDTDITKAADILHKYPKVVFEIGGGNGKVALAIARKNPEIGVISTDPHDTTYPQDPTPWTLKYYEDALLWNELQFEAQNVNLDNLVTLRSSVDVLLQLPDNSVDYILLVNPMADNLSEVFNEAVWKKLKVGGQIVIKTLDPLIWYKMTSDIPAHLPYERLGTDFLGVNINSASDYVQFSTEANVYAVTKKDKDTLLADLRDEAMTSLGIDWYSDSVKTEILRKLNALDELNLVYGLPKGATGVERKPMYGVLNRMMSGMDDGQRIAQSLAGMRRGSLEILVIAGVLTEKEKQILLDLNAQEMDQLEDSEKQQLKSRIAAVVESYKDLTYERKGMMKRLIPLELVGLMSDHYKVSETDLFEIINGHPDFPLWVKKADEKADSLASQVGGRTNAWRIVLKKGLNGGLDVWISEAKEKVKLIKKKVGSAAIAWRIVIRIGMDNLEKVDDWMIISEQIVRKIQRIVGGSGNAWAIVIAKGVKNVYPWVQEARKKVVLIKGIVGGSRNAWRIMIMKGRPEEGEKWVLQVKDKVKAVQGAFGGPSKAWKWTIENGDKKLDVLVTEKNEGKVTQAMISVQEQLRNEIFGAAQMNDQAKHEIRALFPASMLRLYGWVFNNIDEIPIQSANSEDRPDNEAAVIEKALIGAGLPADRILRELRDNFYIVSNVINRTKFITLERNPQNMTLSGFSSEDIEKIYNIMQRSLQYIVIDREGSEITVRASANFGTYFYTLTAEGQDLQIGLGSFGVFPEFLKAVHLKDIPGGKVFWWIDELVQPFARTLGFQRILIERVKVKENDLITLGFQKQDDLVWFKTVDMAMSMTQLEREKRDEILRVIREKNDPVLDAKRLLKVAELMLASDRVYRINLSWMMRFEHYVPANDVKIFTGYDPPPLKENRIRIMSIVGSIYKTYDVTLTDFLQFFRAFMNRLDNKEEARQFFLEFRRQIPKEIAPRLIKEGDAVPSLKLIEEESDISSLWKTIGGLNIQGIQVEDLRNMRGKRLYLDETIANLLVSKNNGIWINDYSQEGQEGAFFTIVEKTRGVGTVGHSIPMYLNHYLSEKGFLRFLIDSVVSGYDGTPALINDLLNFSNKGKADLAMSSSDVQRAQEIIDEVKFWTRSRISPYPSKERKFNFAHDLAVILVPRESNKIDVCLVPWLPENRDQRVLLATVRSKGMKTVKVKYPYGGREELIVGSQIPVNKVIRVFDEYKPYLIEDNVKFDQALGLALNYPPGAIEEYIRNQAMVVPESKHLIDTLHHGVLGKQRLSENELSKIERSFIDLIRPADRSLGKDTLGGQVTGVKFDAGYLNFVFFYIDGSIEVNQNQTTRIRIRVNCLTKEITTFILGDEKTGDDLVDFRKQYGKQLWAAWLIWANEFLGNDLHRAKTMRNPKRPNVDKFFESLIQAWSLQGMNSPGRALIKEQDQIGIDLRDLDWQKIRASIYEPALVSRAMVASGSPWQARNGGIDLASVKMNLQTQNGGGEIKFHLDPAMLEQLRRAPGFVPVIINIQPMTDLKKFLGVIVNQT